MPAKRKNTRKKANGKKQSNPSLNLVLKRLDKIDQRLEKLEQNTTAEFKSVREEIARGRQETAAEFKAVRGEMAQGFDSLRQEFRSDMAKAFESFHQKFSAEMQKEFEKQGNDLKRYFSQAVSEYKADSEELRREHRQLLTGLDSEAHEHEKFRNDRIVIDAEIHDLQRDVEELKKRDMEKAAAIEKIQKEIDKSKAA
jgi:DNA repair exonuclease SbcCD ATPase subunit